MSTESESGPVHLAGGIVQGSCHACAFFRSRDEEFDCLLPFAREGYERGERGFHIVDPGDRGRWIERLRQGGLEANGSAEDRIEVRVWGEAYLRTGGFDQDLMLGLIQEILRAGRQQGFPLTRLWANMEWALEERPGVEDLVEYETRLNHVLPQFDDVVVCTYDLNRFGGRVVMDILRTHPFAVIGGLLQENPFYMPPDEFLKELRGRRETSPGAAGPELREPAVK